MLVASVFLMIPVAALFVGFFLEEVAEAVEARHYPGLPPASPPGLLSNLGNAVRFAGVVVFANILAVILYFVAGPLAPFVFYAVNGYLLGREYFELVAARHMGFGPAVAFRRRHWARAWLAGTLMAVPLTIPIMNLFVPVLGVATVTHQFHRLWRPGQPGLTGRRRGTTSSGPQTPRRGCPRPSPASGRGTRRSCRSRR